MATVLKNVGTDTNGVREVSDLVSVSGIASRMTTLVTINSDAVIEQLENHGVAVHKVRGDGRVWLPVLSGAPASQSVGDMWLEQDVSLGTVLRIKTAAGVLTIAAAGVSGSGLSYTASAGLLAGHACYLHPTNGPSYAQALVDSNKLYRVRGLVLADTLISNPVQLVTDGASLTMSDWSLLTGAATLVQGANYWLSATPGRYTTTPNAAVGSQVGYAASPTVLTVKTGLIVLP